MSISALCLILSAAFAITFTVSTILNIYKRGKLVEKYEDYKTTYREENIFSEEKHLNLWDNFTHTELLTLLRLEMISKREYYSAYKYMIAA